jgi:hypothetical protein
MCSTDFVHLQAAVDFMGQENIMTAPTNFLMIGTLAGLLAVSLGSLPCHERTVLAGNATLSDSTFICCSTATQLGGAFYLSSDSASLGITSCCFLSCATTRAGGALYVLSCLAFSMAESAGANCTAEEYSAFLFVVANSNLSLLESSATGCVGPYNTLELFCDRGPNIDIVNTSFNFAGDFGSGLFLGGGWVTCALLSVASNIPNTSLILEPGTVGSEVICLALVNNTCKSDVLGLMAVRSKVTILKSLFQANRFKKFIVGSPDFDVVTFIDGLFDFAEFNLVNVTVATINCTLNTTAGALPDCLTRTPHVTRTPGPTPTVTATASRSDEATKTPTASASAPRSATVAATPTPTDLPSQVPRPARATHLMSDIIIGAVVVGVVIITSIIIIVVCRRPREARSTDMAEKPLNIKD